MKKKDIVEWLRKFYNTNLKESLQEKSKYLMKLLFVVIVYGLIISFILQQLMGMEMSLANIIAYGLCAYIIKVEIPTIISSCFPRRMPPMNL